MKKSRLVRMLSVVLCLSILMTIAIIPTAQATKVVYTNKSRLEWGVSCDYKLFSKGYIVFHNYSNVAVTLTISNVRNCSVNYTKVTVKPAGQIRITISPKFAKTGSFTLVAVGAQHTEINYGFDSNSQVSIFKHF